MTRRVLPRHSTSPHQRLATCSLLLLLTPLPLLLLLLFLHQSPRPSTTTTAAADPHSPPSLQQACAATRFPSLCLSTLPHSSTPTDLVLSSLSSPTSFLPSSLSLIHSLLSPPPSDPDLLSAARNCLLFLDLSSRRLSLASLSFPSSPPSSHALASAALLHQYDCLSSLKYVNTTDHVDRAMRSLLHLSELTSNVLSLLLSFRLYPNSTSLWRPPSTERHGLRFPASTPSPPFRGGVPPDLHPDARVCKEGSCYRTIQEAVDAVPDHGSRRFVIQIAAAVYEETVRVPYEKTNVVLVGEGMGRTVVTASHAKAPGVSTFDTATVGVLGDGFMAKDLTVENAAGVGAHQAVAFRCTADRAVLERVEFLGHQDTLYAHALRQYYESCRVEGTVDFVFGNAAAVFRGCALRVRPRLGRPPEKGERNPVTAQGRTDPAQATGFVFQKCTVDGTEEYMGIYRRRPKVHRNYLGRPWKEYSRTVFLNCYLGELIKPEGWLPWRGDFALDTLFYGEFGSEGPGANATGRVPWSSRIPPEQVGVYSVESFIEGDEWIPSVGDGSSDSGYRAHMVSHVKSESFQEISSKHKRLG